MVQYREGSIDDLETIYLGIVLEFQENERKTREQLSQLLMRDDYILLVAEDHEGDNIQQIGFSCLYVPENEDFIWLDYLMIENTYQGKGYGSLFFNEIMRRWSDRKGMFIEIEIPIGGSVNQDRRITYYERLGAQRLPIKYHLPTEIDEMAMNLYYKPKSGIIQLKPDDIKRAIMLANKTIHWDHANLESVWEKNRLIDKAAKH